MVDHIATRRQLRDYLSAQAVSQYMLPDEIAEQAAIEERLLAELRRMARSLSNRARNLEHELIRLHASVT